MPWISNLLLPTQEALKPYHISCAVWADFLIDTYHHIPRVVTPPSQDERFFQEAYTLSPAFRCSLPSLSSQVLCDFFFFFLLLMLRSLSWSRQRHLLTFSWFQCLERSSWWCRRCHGAQGTVNIQEINVSRCAALTFCCSGTELENRFSPFLSVDVTGSVPGCDLQIPAQCWSLRYASLVLQKFGNNPISQYRAPANLK